MPIHPVVYLLIHLFFKFTSVAVTEVSRALDSNPGSPGFNTTNTSMATTFSLQPLFYLFFSFGDIDIPFLLYMSGFVV